MIAHKVISTGALSKGAVRGRLLSLARYITRADAADLEQLAEHFGVLDEKDAHVRAVARYIATGETAERVMASGALNLVSVDLDGQQQELAAYQHRCTSDDTLDHWVVSWRTEMPDEATVEEVVKRFVRALRLEGCPVIWGLHDDTEHRHVHIMILRVDPVTGKAIRRPGEGWDIDAGHRAIAVIEHAYGWQSEENALYAVRSGKLVARESGDVIGRADDPSTWIKHAPRNRAAAAATPVKLSPHALQYEERTGLMSAERIVLEIAAPAVERLGDNAGWQGVHRLLAAYGIEYVRRRSGAVWLVDGHEVKASIVRSCSLGEMVKRFNDYEPRNPTMAVARIAPRNLHPHDEKATGYYAARRAHDEQVSSALREANAVLSLGDTRKLRSSVQKDLVARTVFPTQEAWRRGATPPDVSSIVAEALRSVSASPPAAVASTAPLRDWRAQRAEGFVATLKQKSIVYRRPGQQGRPPLVDVGTKLFINRIDDVAVAAGLRLMAARHPDVLLRIRGGSTQERELIVRVACAIGVELDDDLGLKQAELAPERFGHLRERIASDIRAPGAAQPVSAGSPQTEPMSLRSADRRASQPRSGADDQRTSSIDDAEARQPAPTVGPCLTAAAPAAPPAARQPQLTRLEQYLAAAATYQPSVATRQETVKLEQLALAAVNDEASKAAFAALSPQDQVTLRQRSTQQAQRLQRGRQAQLGKTLV